MPFDSQGNFTRVMNWQDDAANSVPIVASRHDDEDDNFAQGFNDCFCRDGRATATGNFKMGGYKMTGLGNGTTDNDAVNYGQLSSAKSDLEVDIGTKADDDAVVKLTGDQEIDGVKTYTSSPIIPTPAAGDNSTKGATTAFVQTEIQNLYPDLTSGIDLTSYFVPNDAALSYTIPEDGWLIGIVSTNRSKFVALSLDGIKIAAACGANTERLQGICLPVKSGQTLTSDDYFGTYSTLPFSVSFYPHS